MKMTSRERIESALHHREADRTPVFEYVLLSPLADILLKHPYAGDPLNWEQLVHEKGWEAAIRQDAADRVELAVILGHDMMYITPDDPPPAKRDNQDIPPLPTPHDPVEAIKQRNTRDEENLNAPFPEECLLVYVFAREEMQKRGLDLPILAPAYLHGVWTDVDLMQTMLLDPPTAHQHFSWATRQALRYIEKYIAMGIDQIGVGGDFAGTRLIISPKAYRTFIVPEVHRVAQRVHQANLFAVNASDGNLWSVLDDFLFGCEVDGYLEIDMFAGMDLRRLKQQYGERITLYGNLDCGNYLSFRSAESVREHTIDCLKAGMGNGGHILCASNAITASVPLENYLAVVNAYREFFGIPMLTI